MNTVLIIVIVLSVILACAIFYNNGQADKHCEFYTNKLALSSKKDFESWVSEPQSSNDGFATVFWDPKYSEKEILGFFAKHSRPKYSYSKSIKRPIGGITRLRMTFDQKLGTVLITD